ncbi:MAG: hypothetical protein ABI597_07430 [Gammaproteobacteria bacterium]
MKKFSQLMISASVVFTCSTVYAATVKIDTDQLEIGGGCGGSPYVTRPGHLDKIPASLFETYYFGITKHLHKGGQVTLTPSNGEITCETGQGGKPQQFGDKRYCLSN